MKREILVYVLFSLIFLQDVTAQKFFTRTGQISFHSRALLEDIDAYNNQGTFVLDTESGQMQMAVLIKGFQFEKALMQEHFNENYMESDLYPKAFFKGTIKNEKPDFTPEGDLGAHQIEGQLTIRDISRPISTLATFHRVGETLRAKTSFTVKVADYNIRIPAIVRDNIAKEVEIKVELELEKM